MADAPATRSEFELFCDRMAAVVKPYVSFIDAAMVRARERHLGITVRQLRKEHGLTQQMLADEAGISKSYICEIETFKSWSPSAQVALALASVLDTTVEYLVDGIGGAPEPDDQAFIDSYLALDDETRGRIRAVAIIMGAQA